MCYLFGQIPRENGATGFSMPATPLLLKIPRCPSAPGVSFSAKNRCHPTAVSNGRDASPLGPIFHRTVRAALNTNHQTKSQLMRTIYLSEVPTEPFVAVPYPALVPHLDVLHLCRPLSSPQTFATQPFLDRPLLLKVELAKCDEFSLLMKTLFKE